MKARETAMNLTVQSDYAFRTMMYLAVRHPAAATVQEISAHYGISRAHLMVLVNRLGSRGLLLNTRGRGGGIRLARPNSDIRLNEILLATEPGFDLAECFRGKSNQCLITRPCRLRRVLDEALESFLAVLAKYTLADMVRSNPPLVRLLTMPSRSSASTPARPSSRSVSRRRSA
jgi:Rrf2 family nitric oxide-sensitive transcriptional repressor